MTLTIATRDSHLALWQTHHVRDLLARASPGLEVRIATLKTTGDRIADVPLSRIGDRGLFTRELDRALLAGEADLAVHSLKDVPTQLPDGLALVAVLEREDPRDALLTAPGRPPTLAELPAGAVVGTSSLRRRALLLATRPDLRVQDLRGNLDTRIHRLQGGGCDAAVLALAGLKRLGRTDVVSEILSPPEWLPAVGQGAVAVVCRVEDTSTTAVLAALDHAPTRTAVTAERALLRSLEGGCQVPIGALAAPAGDSLMLHAFVAGVTSGKLLRAAAPVAAGDPRAAGLTLAAKLRSQGADELLREARGFAADSAPVSPP